MSMNEFMGAYSDKQNAEETLKIARLNLVRQTQENLEELFENRMVSISYNRRRIDGRK